MNERVTIIVVPRDRFSSACDCVQSIVNNTPEPFKLVILDFGYKGKALDRMRTIAAGKPIEIVSCGRTIPLVAFREYLPRISTEFVVWVDNDTYATPGWLTHMLERAALGARVILPVTLEREGLDTDTRKVPLRNHISHGELRRLKVNGKEYVFDYKPYRRATPEELPKDPHTVDFFELHTFFAETEVLRQLDLPPMVVREHVDIGIQLSRKNVEIWCEPKAVVHFDNIHERPTYADLRFFFFRWDQKLIDQSHTLFKQRWGYEFYNEQFMKNWAYRRKVFSVFRFFGLPNKLSDLASRAFNKLFSPSLPAELQKNPLPDSERVLPLSTNLSVST